MGKKREEWNLYQVLLTPLAFLKVISEKQLLNLTTTWQLIWQKKISSILRLVCSLFSYCSQSLLLLFSCSLFLLVGEFLVCFELVGLGFFPLNNIVEHQTANGYLGSYFCSWFIFYMAEDLLYCQCWLCIGYEQGEREQPFLQGRSAELHVFFWNNGFLRMFVL